MGLSDFTAMARLGITIAGEPFDLDHLSLSAGVLRFPATHVVLGDTSGEWILPEHLAYQSDQAVGTAAEVDALVATSTRIPAGTAIKARFQLPNSGSRSRDGALHQVAILNHDAASKRIPYCQQALEQAHN